MRSPSVQRNARTRTLAIVRVASLALLVFTLVAVSLGILDEHGLPRYRALKQEIQHVRYDNQAMQYKVDILRHQVESLRHDPRAIEEVAREELGLVYSGEIIYRFK